MGRIIPRGDQGSDPGGLPEGGGSGALNRDVERGGHWI